MLRTVGENKPTYLWKDYSMDIHLIGKGQVDKNSRSLSQSTSTLLLNEIKLDIEIISPADTYPLLPSQGVWSQHPI